MKIKSGQWYVRTIVVLAFIGVIAWYTAFQSSDFVAGPQITITSPQGGILVEEPLVRIEGVVERVSDISLNGSPIFIDESGAFSESILLVYGHNIITLEAQDRFERSVSETLELIYN